MEKGAQSYPGQVLTAGGTQVSTGGTQVFTGGTQVATGRTKVARGRDAGGTPKLSSPLSRSIYQAKIGGAM